MCSATLFKLLPQKSQTYLSHFNLGCGTSCYGGGLPVSALAGEDLRLMCNVTTVNEAVWMKGGQHIYTKRISLSTISNIEIGTNDYSLSISNVQHSNSDTYVCKERGTTLMKYCVHVIGKCFHSLR